MNPAGILGVCSTGGESKRARPLSGPRFLAKSLFGKEVQRTALVWSQYTG